MGDLTPRLRILSKQAVILYNYNTVMDQAVSRVMKKGLWAT